MAQILPGGTLLDRLLAKQFRYNGGIYSLRRMIEDMPDNPRKAVFDGYSKWNRRAFNRMNYAEQARYEKRLSEMRVYTINDLVVPKTVFDAVPGTITSDVDAPKPELPPLVIAA